MPESICQTTDFRFEHPSNWIDRTVIVRSAPPEAAAVPPNLVVAHDRMQLGEALGAYVNRQINDLTKSAKTFQLVLRRDVPLAGRSAVELVFTWEAGPGTMKQRQIFCGVGGTRVLSIANTALALDFDNFDVTFKKMLSSFQWT